MDNQQETKVKELKQLVLIQFSLQVGSSETLRETNLFKKKNWKIKSDLSGNIKDSF